MDAPLRLEVGRRRWQHWDVLAVGMILALVILLALLWRQLPLFSDTWYHLGVIRAFHEKGFSLHAWWEFAPYGRPHLYPPLFHLVYLGILRGTGVSLLDLARIHGVITLPLLLAAGWGASRGYFGARAGFLALGLMLLHIGLLFPCSLIMMPGTYALMVWAWLPLLILRGRWIVAGGLLAVVGYLHFGVASVAAVSVLLLAGLLKQHRLPALAALGLGAFLYSPWLVHLAGHSEFLNSGRANLPVFIPLATLVAGTAGILLALRRRQQAALAVLCLVLACSLFWLSLWERFWTYGGFFLAVLGGHALDQWQGNSRRWLVLLLVASAVSVTPFLRPPGHRLAVPVLLPNTPGLLGTPVSALLSWQRPVVQAQLPPPIPDDLGAVAFWVREHVARDALVITDDRLVAASLYVLTGRRCTAGLWTEVMTGQLHQQLVQYRHQAEGYLVVPRWRWEQLGTASAGVELAAFGRYVISQRRAR